MVVRQVLQVVCTISIPTLVVSAGNAAAAAGIRRVSRFRAVLDAVPAESTKAREPSANATDAASARDWALALLAGSRRGVGGKRYDAQRLVTRRDVVDI